MRSEIESVIFELKKQTIPGDYKLEKSIESDTAHVQLKIDFSRWIGMSLSVKHPEGAWLEYLVDSDNYDIAKTAKNIEVSNGILNEIIDVLSQLLDSKIVLGTYNSFPALYIPLKPAKIVYKKRIFYATEEMNSR